MPNKQVSVPPPVILIGVGAILIAVAVLSMILLGGQEAQEPTVIVQGSQQALSDRVNLAEAKAAFDSGSAVFIDVRSVESYQQAHIPGALSIPLNDLAARLDELNKDHWIITYCT